ncbi:dihydroneopterin aldolase [soil metagenome]|nr:dihydroneopterin aldolase [Trueperaceae bacterium]
MARVVLEGMRFHGHHGVFEVEARLGAPFVVDLELEAILPESDDLAATVDYARVYELVRRVVTGERYRLIEALAHRLARDLLATEPLVQGVTVRVHKPHAPLPGVVADVMVEVRHDRAADAAAHGDS